MLALLRCDRAHVVRPAHCVITPAPRRTHAPRSPWNGWKFDEVCSIADYAVSGGASDGAGPAGPQCNRYVGHCLQIERLSIACNSDHNECEIECDLNQHKNIHFTSVSTQIECVEKGHVTPVSAQLPGVEVSLEINQSALAADKPSLFIKSFTLSRIGRVVAYSLIAWR